MLTVIRNLERFWSRTWIFNTAGMLRTKLKKNLKADCFSYYIVHCNAIRWKQFQNWHFLIEYNFWTNDLILILKTSTRPYSCLAKVIFLLITFLTVLLISCRPMENVRFRPVPIWLPHTVKTKRSDWACDTPAAT